MAENAAARAEVLRTRDLIGWAVADPAGATVGTVSDLLIGRDGRVRYLAVKRGLLRGASVLLPVDELEWGEQSLRLTRWLDADLRRLPGYDGEHPLSQEVIEEMERAHPRFYGPPLPFDSPGVEGGTPVVPLREAKQFRLPKTAPNVRGWSVFGEDHERVGVVEEMLVDLEQMKVRYLDVDVSEDLFLLKEDRHVIIPMEAVELRDRGEDVWVHGLTAKQVSRLPAYTGGALDPLVEMRVRAAFANQSAASSPADYTVPPLAPPVDADRTVDYAEPGRPMDLAPPPEHAPVHDLPPRVEEVPPPDAYADAPPPLPEGTPPPLPPERNS
jgi:sporulation protein YlmC with PRC-barrel domain